VEITSRIYYGYFKYVHDPLFLIKLGSSNDIVPQDVCLGSSITYRDLAIKIDQSSTIKFIHVGTVIGLWGEAWTAAQDVTCNC